MEETILNIYLIIEDNTVIGFRAMSYTKSGDDDEKIRFLVQKANEDYPFAQNFEAPKDRFGKYMSYRKFEKLEKQGKHFMLFEEIFRFFAVPEKPLICVTPVVDGALITTLDTPNDSDE